MRNCCSIVISERRVRCWSALACLLLLAGCTHVFFYPSRQQFLSPEKLALEYRELRFPSRDGTLLFGWHLPAVGATRGVVCHFHGNAENISSHILNVSWLPAAGYAVLMTDYRGYGASAGKPDLPGALDDVRAGLEQCLRIGGEAEVPVFALGQSLGAAMLLDVAVRPPYRDALSGVIADSAFASYRRIARDALSRTWLTRPLKYPLSWLVTAGHAPEEAVREHGQLPLLLMHSVDDEVVPYAHAGRIYAAAALPKCFLRTQGPHNAALNPRFPGSDTYRESLLGFMAATGGGEAPATLGCAGLPAAKRLPGYSGVPSVLGSSGAPLLDHPSDDHAHLEQ